MPFFFLKYSLRIYIANALHTLLNGDIDKSAHYKKTYKKTHLLTISVQKKNK